MSAIILGNQLLQIRIKSKAKHFTGIYISTALIYGNTRECAQYLGTADKSNLRSQYIN